jgi:hypothetical protein
MGLAKGRIDAEDRAFRRTLPGHGRPLKGGRYTLTLR